MVEVFVRLSLALLLSLGMALLLAWGWDSSDRAATSSQALVSATGTQNTNSASLDPGR